jgi:5-methylcytosine-specific restriction endonuclease McrA
MPTGNRHNGESRADWAKRQAPIPCACGCGGVIQVTEKHKKSRIPRFLHGHGNGRFRPWTVNKTKITCACGCGGLILLTGQHSWNRIPRFLRGHSSKTGFEQWAKEHRGKQACGCGCGGTFEPSPRHRQLGFPGYLKGHAMRVARPVTMKIAAWVRVEQGRHFCECGCGQTIRIWPRYRLTGIPRFRRECQGRLRAGPAHPSWVADRSAIGRRGQDFVRAVRREILELDGCRCRACGSSKSLNADHIVPVCDGGLGIVPNGQTLCIDCHKRKTQLDLARYWERRRSSRQKETDR